MTEPAVGASTWASGSQVCTGHIGTLTAKDAKKASQSHFLHALEGNVHGQELLNVAGAHDEVDRQNGQQHEHGARQRIEEELEGRVDPARPPQTPMIRNIGISTASKKT